MRWKTPCQALRAQRMVLRADGGKSLFWLLIYALCATGAAAQHVESVHKETSVHCAQCNKVHSAKKYTCVQCSKVNKGRRAQYAALCKSILVHKVLGAWCIVHKYTLRRSRHLAHCILVHNATFYALGTLCTMQHCIQRRTWCFVHNAPMYTNPGLRRAGDAGAKIFIRRSQNVGR